MRQSGYCFLLSVVTLLTSITNLYSQTFISKRLSNIMQSTANDEKKLRQLYFLKKTTEENRQTNDTGYVCLLLTIANFESDKENDSLAASLATESLQKAHQLSSQISPTLTLRSYYNVATFYFFLNFYDKALPYYDTIIELSSKYDPDDYLLNARYYRASINDKLGDYEKVIDDSKMGLSEAMSRKNTLFYKMFLYFLSHSLMIQDEFTDASEKTDEYIKLSKNSNDSSQLANAYNIKAWIYKKQKNYKLAEQYYKMALQIIPHTPDTYNAIAIDYNDLGILYLNEMAAFEKASTCFKNVTYFGNKCSPEERSSKKFLVLCNSGDLYAASKLPFKAIQFYSQALQHVNVNVADFVNKNPLLQQLKLVSNKESLLSILSSKCILLLNLYKATHQQSYLQGCIQTSVLADSLITQMRHEQLGEKSKLYWRNKTHDLFSTALEACFISHNADSAFYFMEKSRSVLLTDKLNDLNSSASYLIKNDIDRETGLQRKIVTLEKKLSSLPSGSAQYHATENILLQTKEDLEKHIKSIEKKNPRYYHFKYADDIPTLSDLRHYLKKNKESFIYYFVNDSSVYALGISGVETKFIKVPSTDFDSRQLSDFLQLCSSRQAINRNYALYSSVAQTIYTKLFKPLSVAHGNVAICTDNFFIPFEALCTDDKGKHFLLNEFSFSYVYSARSLIKPYSCNSKPTGQFAGFAPVSFVSALSVLPLNSSSDALKNISQYYQDNVLFTGEESTRYNFLNQASNYAVVTIFSHAKADTSDKEPVLYMQDSLIHLSDLQMLKNSATQLVLLSACQTNIGKNATGEGIYSLARGFATAGVPSVSATLWKADEETVYKISTKFNEYLAGGMNKSDALRQAKLWYFKNADHEHQLPFYWANLVLIGNAQPLSFLPVTNYNWLWLSIVVIAFVAAIVFGIYRYKKSKSKKIIQ